VTHAAVYAHFEDKEDLIAAAKAEGFRRLNEELAATWQGRRRSLRAPSNPRREVRPFCRRVPRALPADVSSPAQRDARHDGGSRLRENRQKRPSKCCEAHFRLAVGIRARGPIWTWSAPLSWDGAWCMGSRPLWVDGPLRHVAPPRATLLTLAKDLVPAFLAPRPARDDASLGGGAGG